MRVVCPTASCGRDRYRQSGMQETSVPYSPRLAVVRSQRSPAACAPTGWSSARRGAGPHFPRGTPRVVSRESVVHPIRAHVSSLVVRHNAVRAEIVDGSGRARQPRSAHDSSCSGGYPVLASVGRSRRELLLENIALRQQLATMVQRNRPRIRFADRVFWIVLRLLWARWAEALVIVKPETVVGWHRAGFRLYCQRLSRRGMRRGRPVVPGEVRDLIRGMAAENQWGAPSRRAAPSEAGGCARPTAGRWAPPSLLLARGRVGRVPRRTARFLRPEDLGARASALASPAAHVAYRP